MAINELTLKAIQNYYQVLRRTGTMKDSQVYQLLLLVFINDLIQDSSNEFMTDLEYTYLTNLIACLSKSTCSIPYTGTALHIDPIKNYLEDTPIRTTENKNIRLSEDEAFRLVDL